ncbi:1-(5-phosphoribosyl)-5-amino-4-imidazole-carboxylate carboxylase, partial [candidate division WOR_3 bacterium SM1_77]
MMKKDKIYIDPFAEMGYAKIDLHRAKRKGFPEVVFCEGKTKTQILAITAKICKANDIVLLTRVSKVVGAALKKKYPKGKYHSDARVFHVGAARKKKGLISILTGGTADIPVAEEAAVTAEVMGSQVQRIYDVGVAGVHRLIAFRTQIEES